jgi:hypothetical protein
MQRAEELRFPSFPPLLRVVGTIPLCVGLGLIAFSGMNLVPIAIGLVIAVLGGAVTLGRRALVIDPARGRVFDALGLVVPMFERRSVAFREFEVVAFGLSIRTIDGAANIQYWVALFGPSHKRSLVATESFLEARQTAERVAKVMGLGVLDQATLAGYREPGSLDVSLRQRLLSGAALPVLGPLPPRFSAIPGTGVWSWRLPRAALLPQLGNASRLLLLALLAQIINVARLVGPVHPNIANDPSMMWVMNGFSVLGVLVGIVVLVLVVRELRAAERDTIVHASPHGLILELRGLFGTRTLTLESNSLETLGVGRRIVLALLPSLGPERIVAASDRLAATFGIGCTEAERTWLIQAIWHALISDRGVRA